MNILVGMRRRRTGAVAISAALAAVGLLTFADAAAAGSYQVFQCSTSSSGNPGADPYVVKGTNDEFVHTNSCGSGNPAIGVHIPGRVTTAGRDGRWTWSAPPGTLITHASASIDLRNHAGFRGRVFTSSGDIHGDEGVDGWSNWSWSFPGGRSRFGVRLVCASSGGCDSGGSTQARAYLRNVRLTLADSSPPGAAVGGPLTQPGWHRGAHPMQLVALDGGSGVSVYVLYVNGKQADAGLPPCARVSTYTAARMRPCGNVSAASSAGNTTNAALGWRNGANDVRLCAWDFSGTQRCSATRRVNVDNRAPELAFRNAQQPSDPELIRARTIEPHSGIEVGKVSYRREGTGEWHELPTVHRDGELLARVDSEAVPAGRYHFKTWAQDHAGNRSGEVIARENGQPMTLRFPLRAETELRASIGDGARKRTIGYGRQVDVTGRLRSADRDPLPFQAVIVHERYDPGSVEAQHTSEAVTDKNGRFTLRLPAGPSRTVSVSYRGSKRYRPAGGDDLQLNVRSGVKFNTSRERVQAGKPVRFGGKVKHRGTDIPSGGKLVELQVKEGAKRWGTVKEAFFTREDGRYRLRYRFGNFYSRPVRFKFRVKVTREQGWPYKAPVRSRARRVTVVP
jgi:hypothetical protein